MNISKNLSQLALALSLGGLATGAVACGGKSAPANKPAPAGEMKGADASCGENSCGAAGEKGADHKCGGDKGADHKCGGDKGADASCGADKGGDHSCGADKGM